MSTGAVVATVLGVAVVGVGVALYVGHRSTVKAAAAKAKTSSGGGISASSVFSTISGAVSVGKGIVDLFSD